MDNNAKKTYYTSFSTQQLLGAKEILKSMPMLYNRVYFSSKYANVLYDNTSEEFFENVSLLAPSSDLNSLRQIIKTNFLYINEWDSINFTDNSEDYGFSFIAGKIKFIVMPFDEIEDGYKVYSYDAVTGNCLETTLKTDKKVFFNTIINDNGEIVKTCDFNIEYMNEKNTKHFIAQKKANLAVVESNSGFVKHNILILVIVLFLCVCSVIIASKMVS